MIIALFQDGLPPANILIGLLRRTIPDWTLEIIRKLNHFANRITFVRRHRLSPLIPQLAKPQKYFLG